MPDPILITGFAGTGKTTRVMDLVQERVGNLVAADHQKILGMSFMHGARRRLDEKLSDISRGVPYHVTTIDAFAISILNRWRTGLGFNKPITGGNKTADITEGLFEIQMSFERIRSEAAQLISKQTTGKIIAVTYPLIVVDEFQDCQGAQLDLVKALSKHSQLLLAADDFQLLNPVAEGCAAVEWIQVLSRDGKAVIEDLTIPRRTASSGLLDAARSLRGNVQSAVATVPVVCCPSAAPAAFWIIFKIAMPPFRWKGGISVISPTMDSFVMKTLESCQSQLAKRNLPLVSFELEQSQHREMELLTKAPGVTEGSSKRWLPKNTTPSPFEVQIAEEVATYCRLRGISEPSDNLVFSFAERALTRKRAFGRRGARRVVTTIHGAKNREFENVFVLWNPNTVGNWSPEEQRRLLYNAITRAKNNCIVLFLGNEKKALSDPVLRLLGPTQPAFPPKKKSSFTKIPRVRRK